MSKSRIETFIGFCIKSRKIALGGVHLLIMDGGAANNSKRLALKFKNRFDCPLLICKSGFDVAVNKPDCKLAAIRDESLAKAILDSQEENYELYCGGSF